MNCRYAYKSGSVSGLECGIKYQNQRTTGPDPVYLLLEYSQQM